MEPPVDTSPRGGGVECPVLLGCRMPSCPPSDPPWCCPLGTQNVGVKAVLTDRSSASIEVYTCSHSLGHFPGRSCLHFHFGSYRGAGGNWPKGLAWVGVGAARRCSIQPQLPSILGMRQRVGVQTLASCGQGQSVMCWHALAWAQPGKGICACPRPVLLKRTLQTREGHSKARRHPCSPEPGSAL